MSTVRAAYSGFVGHEGVPVLLADGEEYDADHPLVLARPELFTEPPAPPKRPVLRGKGKAADKAGEPPAAPEPAPGKDKAKDGDG